MLMPRDRLAAYFRRKRRVLVAYSGGVDSGVLLRGARDAVGDGVLAVTFDTPTTPAHDLRSAAETARKLGVRHLVAGYDELSDARFMGNPADRCYWCKRMMAGRLMGIAREHGIRCVVEGTNAEDLEGHRPGYKALREAGVKSPLAELGLMKADVRALAKEYGLDWRRPSSACLASRIRTGVGIRKETLSAVDESEDYLRSLGLTQVRVRIDSEEGDVARIEAEPGEFGIIIRNAEAITKKLPFRRVSLDLRGYS